MKRLVLAIAVLGLLALPAVADVIYSNVGDPPSFNCCNGWTVGGKNSPVGLVRDAEQFTAGISGSVGQIDVALGWVTGANSATVSLWTSVNDLPGTMLGSWAISNMPVFGSTSTDMSSITGISGISVTGGSQYFLVIEAADSAWEAWNWSNSDIGLLLQDSGSGWNAFPGNPVGAFDVLTGGNAVPEPGTLVMLGTGALGLAGAIRRKLF